MTKEEIADDFMEIMKDYMARQDDDSFDAASEIDDLFTDLSNLYYYNNNPQPLTHMTDFVTPQPTAKDHLTNAQGSIDDVYNAAIKVMRDIEEAKTKLPSDTPVVSDEIMRKLVAYVWSVAIEYAQEHVDDNLSKEVDGEVRVDEDCSSYGLTARISGTVEQSMIPNEVGIDFEIPNAPDLDEILKDFKERKLAAETAIHINLSKDNA